MGHVGEEGAARFELLDEGDGFGEVGVAGVRLAAEGVENEDVEALEERDGLRWEVAHVREVGGGAETIAGDGLAAMDDGDALKVGSEEVGNGTGGAGDFVDGDAGAGRVAVLGAEGVAEDAAQGGGGGSIGVEGDLGAEAERAEVIHAEDVVGVVVGVEDGVDTAEALAEGLRVEVGAGVDEDGVVVVLDTDGRAGAPVAWVAAGIDGGATDGAGATERGDAHGGAGAEEGEGGEHLRGEG